MKKIAIRLLRPDEIEVRPANISDKVVRLVLYKDARCDMNILDESFGQFGWKREHSRDNANCRVSVFNEETGEWVSKEDTGSESKAMADKGLASDSFKRACVNWGIGRELYSAPKILIKAEKCKIVNNRCYNNFKVAKISYDGNRNINGLAIIDKDNGNLVFLMDNTSERKNE